MMLAVNLGSRGLNAARALLEYCNHPGGTYWSDLRGKTERQDPTTFKTWCLGNEMDGPWQIGHKTLPEYGRLANEVGEGDEVRSTRTLELVACGIIDGNMPTYPDWESDGA